MQQTGNNTTNTTNQPRRVYGANRQHHSYRKTDRSSCKLQPNNRQPTRQRHQQLHRTGSARGARTHSTRRSQASTPGNSTTNGKHKQQTGIQRTSNRRGSEPAYTPSLATSPDATHRHSQASMGTTSAPTHQHTKRSPVLTANSELEARTKTEQSSK